MGLPPRGTKPRRDPKKRPASGRLPSSRFGDPILPFSTLKNPALKDLLTFHRIQLTVEEARFVHTALGRDPTLTEATIFSIQGSEHCSYKSSRMHLGLLPTTAPNVMVGVGEDAGIVEIARQGSKRFGAILGHESHNHPSQIVPYEGAATGVGGLVRDIACMGGKVIGVLDPLRFGDITHVQSTQIAREVVSGIAGYGNPLGVPNLGGDIYFDETFQDNCLVNVMAVGVIEAQEIIHSHVPKGAVGYDIIFVGKPTDASGMGGAAFASTQMSETEKHTNKSAVQEPNPFLERHILAATYELFAILKEKKMIAQVAFKDLGAGGNVCASVEMVEASGLGADIELTKIHSVPLHEKGGARGGFSGGLLPAHVIACSETQERFCWIVPHSLTPLVLKHYNEQWALPEIAAHARASVAGTVTDGPYRLFYHGQLVCDAPASLLTKGFRYDRPRRAKKVVLTEPEFNERAGVVVYKDKKEWKSLGTYTEILVKLLASENIASRRPVYEKYDKNVQGLTWIEPGQADAGVMVPLTDRGDANDATKRTAIALTVDGNARFGRISPYLQAYHAVVESCRNVAAVGASPSALTDCLNYGNPEKPDQMWELVEGIRGLRDSAQALTLKSHPDSSIPYISGNVSLYNESKHGSIAASAIVGCLGVMPDYRKAITMQFKKSGSRLYLLGARSAELGGSEYYRLMKALGSELPLPNAEIANREIWGLTDAIDHGWVLAAHDISEGGLTVAVTEMALGGNAEGILGCEIELKPVMKQLRLDQVLFGETGGFVIEVHAAHTQDVETLFRTHRVSCTAIGTITSKPVIEILRGDTGVIELSIDLARTAWFESLREKLK